MQWEGSFREPLYRRGPLGLENGHRVRIAAHATWDMRKKPQVSIVLKVNEHPASHLGI